MVEGQLQKEGEVIHVIVRKCADYSKLLKGLNTVNSEDLSLKPKSRADETTAPPSTLKGKQEHVIQGKIFHEGRNFK